MRVPGIGGRRRVVRRFACAALLAAPLCGPAGAEPLGSGTARFLLTDLDLRDPHFYVNAVGCRDITDTALAGFSINGEIQASIQTDRDFDGFLDLSYVLEFLPLDQGATTLPLQFGQAVCTAPLAGTSCGALLIPTPTTATLGSTLACLAPLPGTTRPYSPAIVTTTPACFASDAVTLVLGLAGIPVTLRDARVAATWVGDPATQLVNGLISGFVSEADANAVILPASLPLVGGQPLSTLLPGGGGNCASHSDKDLNNGVTGWWFYFNFPAARVYYASDALYADGFEEPG